MSNNKDSFFRIIDEIDHCKDVICAKEEDVNLSMKKYRKMIHDSSEAYTEKAINLCIFAVVQVFSEELDKIYDELNGIIDELASLDTEDNQEV